MDYTVSTMKAGQGVTGQVDLFPDSLQNTNVIQEPLERPDTTPLIPVERRPLEALSASKALHQPPQVISGRQPVRYFQPSGLST